MNKIQKIIDAVRDANPETRELSFGCEVKYHYSESDIFEGAISYGWNDEDDYVYGLYYPEGFIEVKDIKPEIGYIEIIGHPLYPHHLLVTAYKKDISLNISQLGELFQIKGGDRNYIGCIINLTKPLTEQLEADEKLVDSLYELLCE